MDVHSKVPTAHLVLTVDVIQRHLLGALTHNLRMYMRPQLRWYDAFLPISIRSVT